MRKTLFINLMLASLAFTACSEGSGLIVTDTIGPEAPINAPDTGVFTPVEPSPNSTTQPSNGGSAGSGSGEPGGQSEPVGGGGNQGGSSSNTGTGEGGNPGAEPGGSNGSQPVPEPGTLFLVGSGLAGFGASLLRRRRRREEGPNAA